MWAGMSCKPIFPVSAFYPPTSCGPCLAPSPADFRPAYLTVGELREDLKGLPIIAATATATGSVRQSIVSELSHGQAGWWAARVRQALGRLGLACWSAAGTSVPSPFAPGLQEERPRGSIFLLLLVSSFSPKF